MKLEPFEMPQTLKPYTYDTAKFGDVIADDEGDTWLIGKGSNTDKVFHRGGYRFCPSFFQKRRF